LQSPVILRYRPRFPNVPRTVASVGVTGYGRGKDHTTYVECPLPAHVPAECRFWKTRIYLSSASGCSLDPDQEYFRGSCKLPLDLFDQVARTQAGPGFGQPDSLMYFSAW
jgi:hypothetical protein